MIFARRHFLKLGGAAALAAGLPLVARAQAPAQPMAMPAAPPPLEGAADYTIRIATGLVELAPEVTLATKTYNGQFPGPLLRMTEGKRVTVDIHNDTDTPELLHWHGQFVPAAVDGAAEEGSPFVPPHGMQRVSFTPGPAGFRFYHSHVVAGSDLSAGTYSGQVGPLYIEPRREPGAYDREIFLTLKEFAPYLSRTEMAVDFLGPTNVVPALREASQNSLKAAANKGLPQGYEVAYDHFSVNGRMLGFGEPIRVKAGERVLFHVLNASATENRSLTLPGHRFKVVALDGNPVPTPAEVPILWLGTAERVSAIVEMNHPGIWAMGDLMDEDRGRGMGIVVEYAGQHGKPRWTKPGPFRWDYRRFAKPGGVVATPDEVIEINIGTNPGILHGFDQFTINGTAFSMAKMEPVFKLHLGKRYRLRMRNATDDVHPMHLHRHSFELTKIAGQPTAGIIKDVAMVGAFQELEVDFTADQPGLSLFHCHMQIHMDFGLMALFDCA
jgi:FtsP/CotA-like multicopper oxidase with cupredoxin domain